MNIDIDIPEGLFKPRRLGPPDLAALQKLFEQSVDYFEMTTGAPPGKDEAERSFVAGPPTKSVADKRMLGVFSPQTRLVGALDAIIDWPGEGCWTMGMLLMDPEFRRMGLATRLLSNFEIWARSEGAKSFRTAVVSEHEIGRDFLNANGYNDEEIFEGYDAGSRVARIVFMIK